MTSNGKRYKKIPPKKKPFSFASDEHERFIIFALQYERRMLAFNFFVFFLGLLPAFSFAKDGSVEPYVYVVSPEYGEKDNVLQRRSGFGGMSSQRYNQQSVRKNVASKRRYHPNKSMGQGELIIRLSSFLNYSHG